MPIPTRPTAPPQPLRSNPDTFSARAELSIQYQWTDFPAWQQAIAEYTEQQANAAASAAAAAGAAEGFDLTNRGGYFLRARFDETSTEFVPPSDAGTVPPGGIIMWSGAIANIPEGWALCDGSNGTPNLRDRFIVGAGGSYAPGATGGASSVTLTEAQMPAHAHYFNQNTNTAGEHSHTYSVWFQASNSGGGRAAVRSEVYSGLTQYPTAPAGSHAHNVQGPTDTRGSGQAHENRPPYYALAYIMKL